MNDKEYKEEIDSVSVILFFGGFLIILAIVFLLTKEILGESIDIIAGICGVLSLWCFLVAIIKKDHAAQMRVLSKIESRLDEMEIFSDSRPKEEQNLLRN